MNYNNLVYNIADYITTFYMYQPNKISDFNLNTQCHSCNFNSNTNKNVNPKLNFTNKKNKSTVEELLHSIESESLDENKFELDKKKKFHLYNILQTFSKFEYFSVTILFLFMPIFFYFFTNFPFAIPFFLVLMYNMLINIINSNKNFHKKTNIHI